MVEGISERLTKHFYNWEQRGRGWLVFPHTVSLEPPFENFAFKSINEPRIDDGKAPSIFSKLKDAFFQSSEQTTTPEESPNEILAPSYEDAERLTAYTVTLPANYKINVDETEHLLFMLGYCQYPLSFEIIATYSEIRIQIVSREPDSKYVNAQCKAYFPQAVLQDARDTLYDIIPPNTYGAVLDYGLEQEFTRPIQTLERSKIDPFVGMFAILEQVNQGEQAAIQILFGGAVNSWADSILRSVTGSNGSSFFSNAPEMLPLAKEKVSKPLYSAVIRAVASSYDLGRANTLAFAIGQTITRMSYAESNVLQPLLGYDENLHMEDTVLRRTHRPGMILNLSELAQFVHFPGASVISTKLKRAIKKTKSAPAIATGHPFILGTNTHEGVTNCVSVSAETRLRHTHIIGATGTGKSTLLLNLIEQDIRLGNGLAVLDPHGDLIEAILGYIPKGRYEDVIIVDPADSAFPVAFNILSAHSEIEKDILSSDLVAVFRRLSTSWGDQMNSVFANAILAFLESSKGGTLIDLRSFLIEKSFRDEFLKTVSDPHIVYYWEKEYPLLKSSSIGSILTRLDSFLRPKMLRNMVAQKKSFDFENILDTKKILLVKLSQGLIGSENSFLLGSFFVTKIYQAAMARQAKQKEQRSDFQLYIDEFQNFITPSLSSILSGTRKYHLGLTLAHQNMNQLAKYNIELASAVISNVGTRICFRVGDIDAKHFESGFSFFEGKDLQNLETGEAIVRIDRLEYDFNLTTTRLTEPTSNVADSIISFSRSKYGTPVAEIQDYPRHETLKVEIPVVEVSKRDIQKERPEEQPKAESVTPIEVDATETKQQLIRQKEISEHRYLQMYVKRMAEARGYKATLEVPTPDGGRVDVELERNANKIAVEIGVTTSKVWEVHNVEKCLAAGYNFIAALSSSKQGISAMRLAAKEKLSEAQLQSVLISEPEELFSYLDAEIAQENSNERRIRGYRVKVQYEAGTYSDLQEKKEAITTILFNAAQKNKNS